MMKFIFLLFLMTTINAYAGQPELTVMSYNLENLFDTEHDEGKNDAEYLPLGHPKKEQLCQQIQVDRYRRSCLETNWTEQALQVKLDQLAKVVYASNAGLPDILAVVEVENRNVLSKFAELLGHQGVVLEEGPDERGIDVGLLYRESENLKYLGHKSHAIHGKWFEDKPTRDILEVEFEVMGGQRLVVYVNHWPSQSNPSEARVAAAKKLRQLVFWKKFLRPNIHTIALGDFNVIPNDFPRPFESQLEQGIFAMKNLYTLFDNDRDIPLELKKGLPRGTYFYARNMEWNHLDRIFVGGRLLDGKNLEVEVKSYRILTPQFATRDFKYTDPTSYLFGTVVKGIPLRANHSTVDPQKAGFSDHFAVLMRLKLAK